MRRKNTKRERKYEHQIYQNIKLYRRGWNSRAGMNFWGEASLNRARLNGQSNDKCISYATMSPADSRKIENKSCGDLHSRMRQAHGTQ